LLHCICPLGTKRTLKPYSITSSPMERKPGGTSMPSVNIRGSEHRSGISKSSKESNTTVSVLSPVLTGRCTTGHQIIMSPTKAIFPPGSASASAPFWTLDQEIFEKERTLTAVQGRAAGQARYYAICSRSARGFGPNDFVPRCAVPTFKWCRKGIRHGQKIDWDHRRRSARLGDQT